MLFKKVISIIFMALTLSSCALWPYKKDFDCPVPEGLKCKSLYEISQLADQGYFGPSSKKNQQNCICVNTPRTKIINKDSKSKCERVCNAC